MDFFPSKKVSFPLRQTELAQIPLNEDNIISDIADTGPGDHIILLTTEAEELAGPGDNNGRDLAAFTIHLYIRHIAQAAAVADVDDLFALELGKPVTHSLTTY